MEHAKLSTGAREPKGPIPGMEKAGAPGESRPSCCGAGWIHSVNREEYSRVCRSETHKGSREALLPGIRRFGRYRWTPEAREAYLSPSIGSFAAATCKSKRNTTRPFLRGRRERVPDHAAEDDLPRQWIWPRCRLQNRGHAKEARSNLHCVREAYPPRSGALPAWSRKHARILREEEGRGGSTRPSSPPEQ